MKTKAWLYHYLFPTIDDDLLHKFVNLFIVTIIILNVVVIIFESSVSLYEEYKSLFNAFEYFTISIFTIEYVLRVYCITEDSKYKKQITGRLKYIVSIPSVIDLFSVLPFYVPFAIYTDLRFIRVLRLFRFIRIFKLGRYSKSIRMISNVFVKRKEDLIITIVIASVLMLFSSCFIFVTENEAQPDKFANIFESMYWSVITLTSVGYGDMYPVTLMGKLFTMFIAIIGLGLIALPAGIITAGLMEEMKKTSKCPHCGKEIES
jgi:voltage-gated potassium channel